MGLHEAIEDATTGECERLKEYGIRTTRINGTSTINFHYRNEDHVASLKEPEAIRELLENLLR